MSKTIAVNVPDIGNFKDIPVIEILVKVGDTVAAEQSLITQKPTRQRWMCPRLLPAW